MIDFILMVIGKIIIGVMAFALFIFLFVIFSVSYGVITA